MKTFDDVAIDETFSWAASDMGATYVKTKVDGYRQVLRDGTLGGTEFSALPSTRQRLVR